MPATPTKAIHDDRFRLLHGPYRPPDVKPGQILRCAMRGEMPVARYNDARIPWPIARNVNCRGRGRGPYIVCGHLVEALKRESNQAIAHWWGVSRSTVSHWRRALGIPEFNEGTKRLWAKWRPAKLPDPASLRFSPQKMRARRLELGLTTRQFADRLGWSHSSYGQREEGRRTRATEATLAKIAAALECRVEDLLAPRARGGR